MRAPAYSMALPDAETYKEMYPNIWQPAEFAAKELALALEKIRNLERRVEELESALDAKYRMAMQLQYMVAEADRRAKCMAETILELTGVFQTVLDEANLSVGDRMQILEVLSLLNPPSPFKHQCHDTGIYFTDMCYHLEIVFTCGHTHCDRRVRCDLPSECRTRHRPGLFQMVVESPCEDTACIATYAEERAREEDNRRSTRRRVGSTGGELEAAPAGKTKTARARKARRDTNGVHGPNGKATDNLQDTQSSEERPDLVTQEPPTGTPAVPAPPASENTNGTVQNTIAATPSDSDDTPTPPPALVTKVSTLLGAPQNMTAAALKSVLKKTNYVYHPPGPSLRSRSAKIMAAAKIAAKAANAPTPPQHETENEDKIDDKRDSVNGNGVKRPGSPTATPAKRVRFMEDGKDGDGFRVLGDSDKVRQNSEGSSGGDAMDWSDEDK
ncbi:hypothetical protein Dda_9256 [Drechslerella dactyloides]|uniref:Uncharacterized protein n=1 Tax=Drechslerella dactyloides TaxID=74499 RepID=A0AAD6IQI2_DREDA|nr:hypothetical protein Dda_9256 [Drechslerella dactyloides]